MDMGLVTELAEKNPQDLAAVEQALGGLLGILKLMPHLTALYATAQAYEAQKAAATQKT
jgi:hypothetical protein